MATQTSEFPGTGDFARGIHPNDRKAFSADRPIQPMPAPAKVVLPLQQHVGAPCEPAVTVGQRVSAGALVGKLPISEGKPAMGAPVHASIDGTVTAIADGIVWIEG